MRHHTPHKPMVRLEDAQGRVVTCTGDHSVFEYRPDGAVREALAQDLKVGDALAVCVEGSSQASGSRLTAHTEALARVYTYDLSVPGDENFVLTNGILAHNSYSIGGINLDIERSSKYESLKGNAEQQFEKMMTDGKARTVKYMRGLKQSRYGLGVRSSFGPITGNGTLTPRKFMGI